MNFLEYLDKYNVHPVFLFIILFVLLYSAIRILANFFEKGLIPFLQKTNKLKIGDIEIEAKNSKELQTVMNTQEFQKLQKKYLEECTKRFALERIDAPLAKNLLPFSNKVIGIIDDLKDSDGREKYISAIKNIKDLKGYNYIKKLKESI